MTFNFIRPERLSKEVFVLDVKRMMRSSENSATGNMWDEDSIAIQGKVRRAVNNREKIIDL